MLLVACSPAGQESVKVTPIPPKILPDFLVEIRPDQGATLSLDDYQTKVCVQVDACDLIGTGDFWDFEDVYTRTTILVDHQPPGGLAGYAYSYMVGCIETDSEGNVVSSAGGPYEWCVCAPLTAGIHRVDLSFEKSSGEVLSFAWTFELVDGPVPTPTSLPVPSEVN